MKSTITALFLFAALPIFSQQAPIPLNLAKVNNVQIANFKPRQAKSGDNMGPFIRIRIFRKPGREGQEGKPGPDLTVNMSTLRSGDSTLLCVRVSNGQQTNTYFVNPRWGQLKILADGGDGGMGGTGDSGADEGKMRAAGSGESGGNGGMGGRGGAIEVTMDSSAVAYAHCPCIIYSNHGGNGGIGGRGGEGGHIAMEAPGRYTSEGESGMFGTFGLDGPPVRFIIAAPGKIALIK